MASFLWLYDMYSGSLGYTCYTSSYRVSATAASMGEVLSHSVQDWAQTFAAFQQMLQADRPVVMKACRCAVPSLHSMQLQNLRCPHRMRLTPPIPKSGHTVSPLPDAAGLHLVSVQHGFLGARIGFSRLLWIGDKMFVGLAL